MRRQVTPAHGDRFQGAGSLRFFVREAFRRIWVSRRTSFVAIAMIAISLTIVGAFLLIAENLTRAVDRWQGESRLTIYLDTDIPAEEIAAIDAHLAASPTLERRKFVSRDEALSKFKSFFSDLGGIVDELGENPFPASFEVSVNPAFIRSRNFAAQISAVRQLPGVDDIQFDWEWVARLRGLVSLINVVGLFVGGILGLAAAFTIANVTRLTMVLYREEIEIMRLVGATEATIRGPFLMEGILQGLLGALIALGLLYGAFIGAQRLVTPANALVFRFFFLSFLSWEKIAALAVGGTVAGLIGSWFSVRSGPTGTGAKA